MRNTIHTGRFAELLACCGRRARRRLRRRTRREIAFQQAGAAFEPAPTPSRRGCSSGSRGPPPSARRTRTRRRTASSSPRSDRRCKRVDRDARARPARRSRTSVPRDIVLAPQHPEAQAGTTDDLRRPRGRRWIGVNMIKHRSDDHLEVIDFEPRVIIGACAGGASRWKLKNQAATADQGLRLRRSSPSAHVSEGRVRRWAQQSAARRGDHVPETEMQGPQDGEPSTILSQLAWHREHGHTLQTAEEGRTSIARTRTSSRRSTRPAARSTANCYWAIGNNDCLSRMPARRQCASDCTTFAAATSFTLNYCLAMSRNGTSTANAPVMTPQD